MMKPSRRTIEVVNLSFLDVISCGFGAVILLLVLSLALEPATRNRLASDLNDHATQIESEREGLIATAQHVQRDLAAKEQTLEGVRQSLSELESNLDKAEQSQITAQELAAEQARIEADAKPVLQTLTEEMRSLLSNRKHELPSKDAVIGGIPVDSEYIIFIIDTSGSMLKVAWPAVLRKVEEVLSVYPDVKGLQIMNDMGEYLFVEYKGRWIPDTPSRRKAIIEQMRAWRSFSNSSPVEGIKYAIRSISREDAPISIYVFGDDFSSGSIDVVLDEVRRMNQKNPKGMPRVRIHAFGYPVMFTNPAYVQNRIRFAHLMRRLAEDNMGSFVGLTKLK